MKAHPTWTRSTDFAPRRRHGFTLVEVLISAIILALGLVGLAAVFPAVISQQQSASDLSTATSVSASADAILATRLPYFRARFADPDVQRALGTTWHRISAAYSYDGRSIYLQTPYRPDMRLREESSYTVPAGFIEGDPQIYRIRLPRRPISMDNRPGDLEVVVSYVDLNEMAHHFTLVGTLDFDPPIFVEGENANGRIDPAAPNSIDYRNAIVAFNFHLDFTESLTDLRVNYRWLNDRIVSNDDRLYPRDNPRYGWEVAFRRSPDNQLQYTTFVYRFEGGSGDFIPAIPGLNNVPNGDLGGMLQRDNAQVVYDQRNDRFLLKTSGSGGVGIADQTDVGSWLLPEEGTNPIRLRRRIENTDGGPSPWYELEGPPMKLDNNNNATPILGNVFFWYVPSRIKQIDDNGQEIGIWHLRPILATTKQVKL